MPLCTFLPKKEVVMTQRDMAGILGVDVKTLRNWRKDKPELYKKVLQGFQFEQAVREAKEHYEKLKKLSDKPI
jgi:hypothetical protein